MDPLQGCIYLPFRMGNYLSASVSRKSGTNIKWAEINRDQTEAIGNFPPTIFLQKGLLNIRSASTTDLLVKKSHTVPARQTEGAIHFNPN